jgi:hypothetical protein
VEKLKILNVSTNNPCNIPYLYSRYIPVIIKEDCISRSFQMIPSEYRFPSDIIQQDITVRTGDVFKNQMLMEFDVYMFHGKFMELENVSRLMDDLNGNVIPYFYDDNNIREVMEKNSEFIENTDLILIRQPHLKMYMEDYKDKVVYVPSPCSITAGDTTSTGPSQEYVLPDKWFVIGHFGVNNVYFRLVEEISRVYDDRRVAYVEVTDMNRNAVLSIIASMNIHLDSYSSYFYSQSAIETIMGGIPTITCVHPQYHDVMDGSPFILADPSSIRSVLRNTIDNIEQCKADLMSNTFIRKHEPVNATMSLINVLKDRGVL